MALNESLARNRAEALHGGGLHCAEAVLLALLEQTPAGGDALVPRMASCFQAGVGRSRKEICGALVGGLMAAGCLLGRDKPGQPLDLAGMTALELRDQFHALYGSTNCSEILAAMGPQESSHLCHQLSGTTAAMAARLLNDAGC